MVATPSLNDLIKFGKKNWTILDFLTVYIFFIFTAGILSFLGCDVGHIFGVGWIEVIFSEWGGVFFFCGWMGGGGWRGYIFCWGWEVE